MSKRCDWCGSEEIYVNYHDEEWGVPEYDGRALWEKLVLDGFQAGLSWITILKKRDAFRAGFNDFDPEIVANYGEADIERLLADAGIVRHRGKIQAAIKGAGIYLEMGGSQAFADYCWEWVEGKPILEKRKVMSDVPGFTDLSTVFSKDLKKKGFNFCGPTIVYAWMQACGLVNDHMVGCDRYEDVQKLAR